MSKSVVRLLGVGVSLALRGVLHLLVGVSSLRLVGLSSLASLFLSGSFGSFLSLGSLLDGSSLSIDFLKVTLNDGTSHSSDLVDLGDVDALSSVVTLIVQPVLQKELVSL